MAADVGAAPSRMDKLDICMWDPVWRGRRPVVIFQPIRQTVSGVPTVRYCCSEQRRLGERVISIRKQLKETWSMINLVVGISCSSQSK